MTFTCFFQVPVQCEKFKPNTWYRLSDFFQVMMKPINISLQIEKNLILQLDG